MQPLAQFSLHTKPIFIIDLKASCESGLQAGAVMWKVTESQKSGQHLGRCSDAKEEKETKIY